MVVTVRLLWPICCNYRCNLLDYIIFLLFLKICIFLVLFLCFIGILIFMSLVDNVQVKVNTASTFSDNFDGSGSGFGFVDFSGCDAGELVKLALQVNDLREQAESYLNAVLVRLGELEGDDAVVLVCKQFGLPAYRTRRQVCTTKGLSTMPDVVRAARDGWITADQAELLAVSHRRAPMSVDEQLDLLAVGVQQNYEDFKNTVLESETTRLAAKGLNPTEQQRARRSAKIFAGDNDMVVLHAELDQLAGERVKTALDTMTTWMLKKDFRSNNERSFEQRNADALVHLITANTEPSTANETCEPQPQQTTIILTADYDIITGQLQAANLIDGTPISIDEIRRLACQANILPAIFKNKKQLLYLGRTQRKPTKTQRLALHKRDKHCTSCGINANSCEIHHIIPWEHGGTTNINNLTLLCPKCHRKKHKHTPQHPLKP